MLEQKILDFTIICRPDHGRIQSTAVVTIVAVELVSVSVSAATSSSTPTTPETERDTEIYRATGFYTFISTARNSSCSIEQCQSEGHFLQTISQV